jgi:hypothetical protein
MWSCVTTIYLISLLSGYVESIAGDTERLEVKQMACELIPFDDLTGV